MSRKKAPVPTPKHVNAVDKIKRGAHSRKARSAKAKQRVKLGTKAAADLGIK